MLSEAQDIVVVRSNGADSYVFAVKPSIDFQRETYRESISNLEDRGVRAFGKYWEFDEKRGIMGSSIFLNLRYDNISLRSKGLWLPGLNEARFLEKVGKLENNVYRDYDLVVYSDGNPNKEIAEKLSEQAEQLGLNLPLVSQFRALDWDINLGSTYGVDLRFVGVPKGIIHGKEAERAIASLNYKGNSGAQRLDRYRNGYWGANWNDLDYSNENSRMAQPARFYIMKTYKHLYEEIISLSNLFLAWRKARKDKTKKNYVIEFEKDLIKNILELQEELKNQRYFPKPLQTFILRDPKTRKISKSDFRDRIVHHALVRVIEPIFDKGFIYDSCANRIGKGNLFALNRFEKFQRKVTNNLSLGGYCLKADIKHYFHEVNHSILIKIMKRRIVDKKVVWLIKKILANLPAGKLGERTSLDNKGMPLGNLTSQFFANVYLNELDYFVKHKLKAKYYIRYVDDFVILHKNKKQLKELKKEIDGFLKSKLKIQLHPDKSRVKSLSNGLDFVGFRIFYYFRLLRARNIRNILYKIKKYKEGEALREKILEVFQGWNAYAKRGNTFKLRRNIAKKIHSSEA
ncbi:MAG: reverse transcriptase domain-containing protein [archaeon]